MQTEFMGTDRNAEITPRTLACPPRLPDDVVCILWSDAYLVLAKPAGLLVHRTRPFPQPNLVDLTSAWLGQPVFPVHRLDRDTSGLVLLARHAAAAAAFAAIWHACDNTGAPLIAKRYLAVVDGSGYSGPDERTIDLPIALATGDPIRVRRAVSSSPAAARARTRIRIARQCGGRALVEAWPQTGRAHQIRVHLSAIGLPIVGDRIYGRDPSLYLRTADGHEPAVEEPECPRHALHAASLDFRDPTSPQLDRVHVNSPLPTDMQRLLASPPVPDHP